MTRKPGLPALVEERRMRVSPWVTLVERSVQLRADGPPDAYHCFDQAGYVTILACTPDGRIPVVRQYRAAIDDLTWELPAGMLDPGEDPIESCRRELLEETGLTALRILDLGTYFPDTGRLANLISAFFVETDAPQPGFQAEPGMELAFWTWTELKDRIRDGSFRHQLHIGALGLAHVWDLPQFR